MAQASSESVGLSALERPRTPEEAAAILAGAAEARVLAGGQSLVPLLTLGFADPDVVVSLDRCTGLDSIDAAAAGATVGGEPAVAATPTRDPAGRSTTADVAPEGSAADGANGPGFLRIGAMVTTRRVELDSWIAARCPLLAVAAGRVGSPHVRNFGTLVGNLCHADPGSDLVPAALCLGAELEVLSPRGTRRVAVDDLVAGPFTTTLAADELATAVRIPLPEGPATYHDSRMPDGEPARVRVPRWEGSWVHGYRKLALRAGDLAIATAAVLVQLEGDAIANARLVVGGALRRPRRIGRLESALAGAPIAEAVNVALTVNWIDDLADDLLGDTATPADYLHAMLPRFLTATLADALQRSP